MFTDYGMIGMRAAKGGFIGEKALEGIAEILAVSFKMRLVHSVDQYLCTLFGKGIYIWSCCESSDIVHCGDRKHPPKSIGNIPVNNAVCKSFGKIYRGIAVDGGHIDVYKGGMVNIPARYTLHGDNGLYALKICKRRIFIAALRVVGLYDERNALLGTGNVYMALNKEKAAIRAAI